MKRFYSCDKKALNVEEAKKTLILCPFCDSLLKHGGTRYSYISCLSCSWQINFYEKKIILRSKGLTHSRLIKDDNKKSLAQILNSLRKKFLLPLKKKSANMFYNDNVFDVFLDRIQYRDVI